MNVYQFKIVLCYIQPEVWRTFHVPEDFSFFDLHLIIQAVMGWEGRYSFDFVINDFAIGEGEMSADAEKVAIKDILEEGDKISYIYDFKDHWTHLLELQKITAVDAVTLHPECLDGAGKCPPEDVGGPLGYAVMLNVLNDKAHPDRKLYLQYLGKDKSYNPAYFSKMQINKKLLDL